MMIFVFMHYIKVMTTPAPGGEVFAVVADHIIGGVGKAALPMSHRQGSLDNYDII